MDVCIIHYSFFLTSVNQLDLFACVKRQREDHGVALRANALLLLDNGISSSQVAKFLFLDDNTVRSWHKQYLAEGWEAVAYDICEGGAVTDAGGSRG